MPSRSQRSVEHSQVAPAIGGVDHEVKDGAIVPEVEAAAEVVISQVGLDPGNAAGLPGQVRLRPLQCLGRNIGDGHVAVASPHQVTGERGGAAADVDQRSVAGRSASAIRSREVAGTASVQLSFSIGFSA